MTNPFRSIASNDVPLSPCVVVIFGASGDLTHRKLVPALYDLSAEGLLPTQFAIVGVARREFSDQKFREDLASSVAKFARMRSLDARIWEEFADNLFYVQIPFDATESYENLRQTLDSIDQKFGVVCKRVFYLATDPRFFSVISTNLSLSGLLSSKDRHKPIVIVEKPFGRDIKSAKALNHNLLEVMSEDQIYRIDHYLGKETVQNLLVFRFSNGIFEPIWNHKYIDHVEISVCESLGVENRGDYFDSAGVLRDIVQNHAFQLLCLVALEPPVAFEETAVRDEKVKVLKAIRRITKEEVPQYFNRAQYSNGFCLGERVPAYINEPKVLPNSKTETYAAMKLYIDNWRWAGVPFFIRAGKRLPKRVTDISIFFKKVPHLLFKSTDVPEINPNVLSFQIQPDEGIIVRVCSKPPGTKVRLQTVNMEFSYGTSFGKKPPEAYERLLLDAMKGDATLFTRADEIEQAWELLEPVLKAWGDSETDSCPMFNYEAGTWGPKESNDLLVHTVGFSWRRL